MNTKGIKFLAVLAVLAMAFAAFAVIADAETEDATSAWDDGFFNNINKIKEPFPAVSGKTYVLSANGDITEEGQTEAAGVWTNGIYLATGTLTLKVKNGETIKMDTTYYGIYVNGALTIGTTAGDSKATKLSIAITGEADNTTMSGFAIASKGLTLTNVGLDLKVNATSTVASGTQSAGIYSYGATALTLDAAQKADIFAGNRAIYSTGALTINGGEYVLGGYEAAIAIASNNNTMTVGGTTAAKVDAKLIDGSGLNSNGSDARFAIKAKSPGSTIIVTAGEVKAQGLFTSAKPTADATNGKIYVYEDYTQNVNKETSMYGGLYVANAEVAEEDSVVIVAKASDAVAGKISVQKGAYIHNYIVDGYTNNVDVDEIADAEDVQEAISDTAITEPTIYVDLSEKNITDYSGDNQLTIPNKEVTINFNAANNIKGTIDVSNAKELTVSGVKTAADTPIVFIGKDNSKVSITSTAAASFSVRNGSVIIEDITTDGTLTVEVNGQYKILGTVSGNGTVDIKKATGATTATVEIVDNLFILADKTAGKAAKVTITGLPVVVTGKITVAKDDTQIGKITFAGTSTVKVNGEITGAGTILIDDTAKLEIMDGGVFSASGTITRESENKIVAWAGSDINSMATASFNGNDWVGKDSNGGQWNYSTTTLTLDNYNGSYNFKPISALVQNIILIGDSSLSYEADSAYAGYTFFGNTLTAIETDTVAGTLAINVDLSAVPGDALVLNATKVLNPAATFKFDEVTATIEVSGSNKTWTNDQIDAMDIVGIENATKIEMLNSAASVSVMAAQQKGDIAFDAIKTVTFEMKASNLIAAGDVTATAAINVSNSSSLVVSGLTTTKAIDNKQESKITVNDLYIEPPVGTEVSSNKSVLNILGDSIIAGAFTNNGALNNAGNMLIIKNKDGAYALNNAEGTFTNTGTVKVPAKYIAEVDGKKLTIDNDDIAATDPTVKVNEIVLTDTTAVADGTLSVVTATVKFDKHDDVVPGIIYEGTMELDQDGTCYTLTLTNETSSIIVAYDSTKEGLKIGGQYTVTAKGTVMDGTAKTISANAKDSGVDDELTGDDVQKPNVASLTVTGGKMVNEDTVIISHAAGAEFLGTNGAYEGALTSDIENITLKGDFDGNLISNGAGTVTIDGTFDGNIAAYGSVTINTTGVMTGDIVSQGTVTVKKTLNGNVMISNSDVAQALIVTSGKMVGKLDYVTEYYATKDATVKTIYQAIMDIDGEGTFTINTEPGYSAGADKAVKPGYFTLTSLEAKKDKSVTATLEQGTLAIEAAAELKKDTVLIIEDDTTLEVGKAFIFDVSKAALKVADGAIRNYGTELVPSDDYGDVSYIMSFDIEGGAYTIYSNIAYALSNCDEGSELVLGVNSEVDSNVALKAGINVIVKDVTLTFTGKNVEMGEGARITIEGNGMVKFAETGKAATTEAVYTVSGTILYDDNVLVFSEVRFDDESVIAGIEATATEHSKLDVELSYKDGTATIKEGYGTGVIALDSGLEAKIKDATPSKISGTFVVGVDAVFDAVSITDAPAVVEYKPEPVPAPAGYEPEIKKYVIDATVVGVEGTLNLLDNTIVCGIYAGFGKVTLADNKTLVLYSAQTPESGEERAVPGSLNLYIVDTSDDSNGYLFNLVSTEAETLGTGLIISATTFTVDKEKIKVMTIEGDLKVGSVKATTAAVLDELNVMEDAVIYGDVVYVIGFSDAAGYVGAQTIYMEETDEDFAELDYEVTFEKDGYTIYTEFASIVWDEITDVVIKHGEVPVSADGKKVDLSGKDVNIVIGDDAALVLNAVLIIGTPATVLGDEGSSIVGKVIIVGTSYLVAYADVDLTFAEIEGLVLPDEEVDVVSSKLDVEEMPYATIYAADLGDELTVKLAKADAAIIPEIVGYNFTAWINYNGDASAKIGETNAYADAKATLCTVVVKYVEGVDYYMNGIIFNAFNIPTDVAYGSYFTAKISDTSKYQGNPLINGEKTVCVIDDMELVASGVTPIPEPPQPEPVIGDSGISLTDILLIVLVVLIAIMVVILVLRLNRS